MINSRKLDDLLPVVRDKALAMLKACAEDPELRRAGITVLVTSTYRDDESQTALYAQGRTAPGKIVTKAKAGYSWHNFQCAFDIVPLRHGATVWGTRGNGIDGDPTDDDKDDLEAWQRIAKHGMAAGLEWGGDWEFKDFPHFQYTGGLSMAQLRAGERPQ